MATENLEFGTGNVATAPGSAGIQSQAPGQASTVSGLANATGGIDGGNLVQPDIDEDIFSFQSEESALMSLMLKAKKVNVDSPEVDHYQLDEERAILTTSTAVAKGSALQFELPLEANDQAIPAEYQTMLIEGVNGYSEDGQTELAGVPLMVYVTGRNLSTNNPIVRAVNGPKTNPSDAYCTVPAVPANSKVILMANAMYETQKEVDPDMIVPRPERLYLQKRGMNQVVSDYFDAQRKRIPFAHAVIAEHAILKFKRDGNRTLWAGHKGKFQIKVKDLGQQFVYFAEGVRWQFKRELKHTGKWTFEKLIALTKMYFTGEDVPKTAILLAGKNLLEELQCVDFSKHPEVNISVKTNKLGWDVTNIHTVFGDIEIKREPTLDKLGWSNSGALIGENRLVHYVYSSQHEFEDRIEGQEATRKGIVVWDGLGLKGSCHIWIDGEGEKANSGAVSYTIWESAEAPKGENLIDGRVYLLTVDCPGINASAKIGQMWQAKVTKTGTDDTATTTVSWSEFTGEIKAD